MPILTLQREMRELGRIRTGVQVASKGRTGTRPAKIETFRLTSDKRALLDAAAEIYRGTVEPWQSPNGPQWQLITTTDTLDILVPPGQSVEQWMEMWGGGGCLRRCNGITNVLDMSSCACPADVEKRLELAADGRACKATTRLWVMLPALPDIGRWRLESHSYYAALELPGAAMVLERATREGNYIPAFLRLQQRQTRRPGKPTLKYGIPIIEAPDLRTGQLGLTTPIAGELGEGTPPQLPGARPQRPVLPETALPESSDFRAPRPSDDEPIDAEWSEIPLPTNERGSDRGAGAPREPQAGTAPPAVPIEPEAGPNPVSGSRLPTDEAAAQPVASVPEEAGEAKGDDAAATKGSAPSPEASLLEQLRAVSGASKHLAADAPDDDRRRVLGSLFAEVDRELVNAVLIEAFGPDGVRVVRDDDTSRVKGWSGIQVRHLQALLEVSGAMTHSAGPDAFQTAWSELGERLL